MVDAHGGDVSVFDTPEAFHKPDVTEVLNAWATGYIAEMDTTAIGWAVQRAGAGRRPQDQSEVPAESIGLEPVDPHAGIVFHARRGDYVEKGQPFATVYATSAEQLAESTALLKGAAHIRQTRPGEIPAPVQTIITRENAEAYLEDAVKVKMIASSS
jgi:pyrimidine-nucleoside phosphorylase